MVQQVEKKRKGRRGVGFVRVFLVAFPACFRFWYFPSSDLQAKEGRRGILLYSSTPSVLSDHRLPLTFDGSFEGNRYLSRHCYMDLSSPRGCLTFVIENIVFFR